MTITAQEVKKLRELTGAAMMDAKKALEKAKGDSDKAVEILRKQGQKMAAKRQDREAGEGRIAAYIHANGQVGAMVELLSETDFVARNEQFGELAYDIAMHVAAANPQYLTSVDVPQDVLEKEKDVYRDQLKKEGKPDNMIENILEGKLKKFYSDICLLDQSFIKDEDKTVAEVITEAIGRIGEKIEIRRFARFSLK